MKKSKLLFPALALLTMISLTGCNAMQYVSVLLNDDDMVVENHFNPPQEKSELDPDAVVAGGVVAKEIAQVPNAYCFKNIAYATEDSIANTYKVGGVNHTEYNVNNNEDYSATKASNNFDLYVPKTTPKNAKHTVILFIHGGAWVSGFKTDVNSYLYEFANKGYITATIKYSLLKRTMDDASLSIFRNLDEIDACIKMMKSVLEELGFDTTKTNLVIGGASSGAHLAMLYSYSRGQSAALPIKFLVDAVGPVDIKPNSWKRFITASDAVVNAGITKEAIQAQSDASNIGSLPIAGEGTIWCDYQTMRIANGMCGIPYTAEEVRASTDENQRNIVTPNDASNSMTKVGGGEDQLSVTYWMNRNATYKLPIVCAYAGKDSIVGINQFATLQATMDTLGTNYELYYFKNADHTEVGKENDETAYNGFVNKIVEWCNAL